MDFITLPKNYFYAGYGIGGLHYNGQAGRYSLANVKKRPDQETFPIVAEHFLDSIKKHCSARRVNLEDLKIFLRVSFPCPEVNGGSGKFKIKIPEMIPGVKLKEDDEYDVKKFFTKYLIAEAKKRGINFKQSQLDIDILHDGRSMLEWYLHDAVARGEDVKNKKLLMILNGSGYNLCMGLTDREGNLVGYSNSEDGLEPLDSDEKRRLSRLFAIDPETGDFQGRWHNKPPSVYHFVSGGTAMEELTDLSIDEFSKFSEYGFKIYWTRLLAAALRDDKQACQALGLTPKEVFESILFQNQFVSNYQLLDAVKKNDKAAIAIAKRAAEHIGERVNRYIYNAKKNQVFYPARVCDDLKIEKFIPNVIFAVGGCSIHLFALDFAKEAFFSKLTNLTAKERARLKDRFYVSDPPYDGAYLLARRAAERALADLSK